MDQKSTVYVRGILSTGRFYHTYIPFVDSVWRLCIVDRLGHNLYADAFLKSNKECPSFFLCVTGTLHVYTEIKGNMFNLFRVITIDQPQTFRWSFTSFLRTKLRSASILISIYGYEWSELTKGRNSVHGNIYFIQPPWCYNMKNYSQL